MPRPQKPSPSKVPPAVSAAQLRTGASVLRWWGAVIGNKAGC